MQMLSGLTGMQGMMMPGGQGMQNMLSGGQGMMPGGMNMQNITGMSGMGSQMQGGSQIQDMMSVIQGGDINKLDRFLNESGGDTQLKADLQGFVEKNQLYKTQKSNSDDDSDSLSGVSPGEVADKFSDVLGSFLNNVNQQNKGAEKAVQTFVTGGNIDLHSVMIAAEKAELSMQLAVQLRNKFVQAYQEVSRISV